MMSHPPYSLNLAHNDFLFLYVKIKLRVQHFWTSDEAVAAFHILEVPRSQWQNCFNNGFKRLRNPQSS